MWSHLVQDFCFLGFIIIIIIIIIITASILNDVIGLFRFSLLDLLLEDCMFLGTYWFLPDCPFCWYVFVLFLKILCILRCQFSFFFKIFKFILFIFRERKGREKERERNINVQEKHQSVASCMPTTGTWPATQAHALSRWPFSLQAGAQSTEPLQPGPLLLLFHFQFDWFGASLFFSSWVWLKI